MGFAADGAGAQSPKTILDEIATEVVGCRLCPLAEGRKNAVPGAGSPRATIVLLGEAPGREEDLSGLPFVGRGGRLLNSALESVGIPRRAVFVTNIVKCRPPRNRPPTSLERSTCKDAYLARQLDALRPQTIVLLGRTAAQALLGVKSLKEVRGQAIRIGDREFLCTYHPAAVLRNPNLRRTFEDDLKKAVARKGRRHQ
jgi:DNA polymerase